MGRLPLTLQSGHEQFFVLCDMDTGCIHGVPVKSQSAAELVCAHDKAFNVFAKFGFEPIPHQIDNETSETLIDAIEKKHLDCKTMPKANHRRNPAERAIQTFESHFISIINGADTRTSPQTLGICSWTKSTQH